MRRLRRLQEARCRDAGRGHHARVLLAASPPQILRNVKGGNAPIASESSRDLQNQSPPAHSGTTHLEPLGAQVLPDVLDQVQFGSAREGRKIWVILLGTSSLSVVCHPARSSSGTAREPSATFRERPQRVSSFAARPLDASSLDCSCKCKTVVRSDANPPMDGSQYALRGIFVSCAHHESFGDRASRRYFGRLC